jgi:hypothetical protein
MGSLVTEFLINPVLRQARRFSRSSQSNNDVIDPLTDQRTTQENTQNDNDNTTNSISARLGHISRSGEHEGNHVGEEEGSISGIAITSSPIEDDGGGLDAELRAIHDGRSPSAPTTSTNAIPRRMLSLTSNSGQIDDDLSDNPSFGIPGRFRASSDTSHRRGVHHGNHSLPSTMTSTQPTSRRSTRDRSEGGAGSPQIISSLPEDDGMGYLRYEIRKIQSSDAAPGEKARLMHLLLTKDYTHSQASLATKPIRSDHKSREADHA